MTDYNFFGEEARFHHVGLAVRSIRAVSPASEAVVEQTQGVSLAFIHLHGVRIELLEPYGEGSPIERNLRDGVRLLHLCYEVPDLVAALARCRQAGFHRIRPLVTTTALENRRIAWVFSRDYGLFELLEAPSPQPSHCR